MADIIALSCDQTLPRLGSVAVLSPSTSSQVAKLVGEPDAFSAPVGTGTTPPTLTVSGTPEASTVAVRDLAFSVEIESVAVTTAVTWRWRPTATADWIAGTPFNQAAGATAVLSNGATIGFPIGTYNADQAWTFASYLSELDGSVGAYFTAISDVAVGLATSDVSNGTILLTATRASNPTQRCVIIPANVPFSFELPPGEQYLYYRALSASSNGLRVFRSSRTVPSSGLG